MFGRKNIDSEAIAGKIRDIAARLMKERGLAGEPDLNAPLAEDGLGFDSMSRLDLLSAVEKETGVSIPEQYWGTRPFKDLAGIVKLVAKRV